MTESRNVRSEQLLMTMFSQVRTLPGVLAADHLRTSSTRNAYIIEKHHSSSLTHALRYSYLDFAHIVLSLNRDFCFVIKGKCTYHVKMQLKLGMFYANGWELYFDCYCKTILTMSETGVIMTPTTQPIITTFTATSLQVALNLPHLWYLHVLHS